MLWCPAREGSLEQGQPGQQRRDDGPPVPFVAEIRRLRAEIDRTRQAIADVAALDEALVRQRWDAGLAGGLASRWPEIPSPPADLAGLAAAREALAPIVAGSSALAAELHDLEHRQRDALEQPALAEVRAEIDARLAELGEVERQRAPRVRRRTLGNLLPLLDGSAASLPTASPLHAAALLAGIRHSYTGMVEALGVEAPLMPEVVMPQAPPLEAVDTLRAALRRVLAEDAAELVGLDAAHHALVAALRERLG